MKSTIYKFFEAEYKIGVGASDLVSGRELASSVYEFVVELQSGGRGTVIFDANRMDIKCSCSKFETEGILCSHALKVFSLKNVHTLPMKYFMTRWSIVAKDRMHRSCDSQSQISIANESAMVFSNQWIRRTLELIMKGKFNAQARLAIVKAIQDAHATVDAILKDETSNTHPSIVVADEVGQNDKNDSHVLDPLYVKAKGVSNIRYKKHFERQNKRDAKASSSTSMRRKKNDSTFEIGPSFRPVLHDVSNSTPSQRTEHPQLQLLDMNWLIGPNIPSDMPSQGGAYLQENPPPF